MMDDDEGGFVIVLLVIVLFGGLMLMIGHYTIDTMPPEEAIPHKQQVVIKSNGIETVWQVDGKRVRIEELE
jgi:hypothetical protein